MNLNLTQKDYVISELTNAITSKDRFIEVCMNNFSVDALLNFLENLIAGA